MPNENAIKALLSIRKSLMHSPAVVDTIWMENENCTTVEAIDDLLIKLGMAAEAVEMLGC